MEKVKEVLSGKRIICNAYPLDIIRSITRWDDDIAYGVLETFPQHFGVIPLRFRTEDMYFRAVQLYPENLKLVPYKVLHYRFENFLKLAPSKTTDLLDKEALDFLFKNKTKFKRVIDALPRPLSYKVVKRLAKALLVRNYSEKLIKWIEEKYPSDWERIVEWKKSSDIRYHNDMEKYPDRIYDYIEHGPPTKYGLRFTWKTDYGGWYGRMGCDSDLRDDEISPLFF